MLSYVGVGLLLASLVLTFRTTGPLSAVILTGSMFLGGVYYPTHVIPSWIHDLAAFLPLTYGLRALRQIVLLGDSLGMVRRDVTILLAISVVTVLAGGASLAMALRRARRTGTLYSY
jgi:ABC-2 type transport system permease protein